MLRTEGTSCTTVRSVGPIWAPYDDLTSKSHHRTVGLSEDMPTIVQVDGPVGD
jgi:hypothetical protein